MLLTAAVALPAPSGAAGGDGAAIEVRSDVGVEAADGTALSLDAYLPPTGRNHPAILLVHGGSWAGGDKRDVINLAATLADRGWATFALDYRLGGGLVPEQARDVRDTVRWIRASARDLRVDPAAISLLGASAGGHIAALAATEYEKAAPVAAVATWSGIFDLGELAPRADAVIPHCKQQCQEFFGAGLLTGVVGCAVTDCPSRYRRQSPVRHLDARSPPMFLAGTTGDAVPPRQAEEMAAALRRAGVEAQTVILRGDEHGYDVGARVLDRTLDFLDGRVVERAEPSGGSTPWAIVVGVAAVLVLGLLALIAARRRAVAARR